MAGVADYQESGPDRPQNNNNLWKKFFRIKVKVGKIF
jgi:hypothetical protein